MLLLTRVWNRTINTREKVREDDGKYLAGVLGFILVDEIHEEKSAKTHNHAHDERYE